MKKLKIIKSSKDHRDELVEKAVNQTIEEMNDQGYELDDIKYKTDLPLFAFLLFEEK